jgi:hypothetical protein
LICLPPFLPADFKEQAGRQAGRQAELKVFTIMCATHLSLYNPAPAHALKALGTAPELLVGQSRQWRLSDSPARTRNVP